jgi:serine/threonine-protein kinase RIO1
VRQREAEESLKRGLESLATYFRKYGVKVESETLMRAILKDTRGSP